MSEKELQGLVHLDNGYSFQLNHFTRMAMYFLNALGIDYRVANDDELVDLLKKKGIDIILSDY